MLLLLQLHENEIMRAFKTVNDAYIEPIAFTVPRRAETFQSDIYPPATGTNPAVSAKEWINGKTGVPAKIDLESVYEGSAPVEVASDYKPAATPTSSAPAPAPASPAKEAPPPKKEPEPTPAPVRTGPPPKVSDQKESISSMANKFQDDDESSDDDDETSSFEEVGRPQPRQAPAAVVTKPAASAYKAPQQASSPPPSAKTPTLPVASRTAASVSQAPQSPAASAPSNGSGDIADALEKLTTLVQVQNSKIDSLTGEVEGLKKRLLVSSEQSERIRQLELELEEARS